MSYEGFSQTICHRGHYNEKDCRDEDETCPDCGAGFAWSNGVDETNFMDVGFIEIEPFLIGTDEMGEELFRVPTGEETRKLRTWLDWQIDNAPRYEWNNEKVAK